MFRNTARLYNEWCELSGRLLLKPEMP